MPALPDSLPLWAVDGILVLVVMESCLLWWVTRRKHADRAFARPWLANLASGVFLLAALRAVLSEAGLLPTLVALSGALVAHLCDLYQRSRLP